MRQERVLELQVVRECGGALVRLSPHQRRSEHRQQLKKSRVAKGDLIT